MAGNKNELPITKTGYQFQSDAELKEAKWLISEGDYKNLDDFGARMQRSLMRLHEALAEKKKTKKAA